MTNNKHTKNEYVKIAACSLVFGFIVFNDDDNVAEGPSCQTTALNENSKHDFKTKLVDIYSENTYYTLLV